MRRNFQRLSVKFKPGGLNLEQQGSDLIADQLKKVQEGEVWLTEIYQRLAKDIKASQDAIDNGKHVQEAMLSYMRQIKEWEATTNEERLAGLLQKAGEFQRCVDDLRHNLYGDLSTKTYLPIREFVKDDIQAAKKAKKRCDQVKSKYESAANNVKSLKTAKNTPPAKLQQAEDELREAKTAYENANRETLDLLMLTNQTNETKTLLRLCDYLTTYHQFFKMGFKWLENLMPMVETCRASARTELEEIELCKKRKKGGFEGGMTSRGTIFGSTAELPPLTRVFGMPLQDVLNRGGTPVPLFLMNCFEYLVDNAIKTEGIFRISAQKDEIDNMKYKIDHGDQEIRQDADIHVVSNIVKLYFRELPEPLLTYELFPRFINASGIHEKQQLVKELNDIFQDLPKANYELFRALILLCHRVSQEEAVNKMGPQNLAVVFTPNILYSKDSDAMSMVEDMASAQNLMTTIIEFARDIFPPVTLFEAALRGDFLEIRDVFESKTGDEVQALLSEKDITGATLLHKAALSGRLALVAYLVDSGSDVNAKDNMGATPLIMSANTPAVVEIARYLIKNGADDQLRDAEGNSIWEKLAESNKTEAITKLKLVLAPEAAPVASVSPAPTRYGVGSPSLRAPPPVLSLSVAHEEIEVHRPHLILQSKTATERAPFALNHYEQVCDTTAKLLAFAVKETLSQDDTSAINAILKNLAEDAKKMLLDVRIYANRFSEREKKEIIACTLQTQDKMRPVINAVKLLMTDAATNRNAFVDACKTFTDSLTRLFNACELGTNDSIEHKIQEIADSLTQILPATVLGDTELLQKAHNNATSGEQALAELLRIKSFRLTKEQSEVLANSSKAIKSNIETIIASSKEIVEKPKEQRITEHITKIARDVLLEFKKIKEALALDIPDLSEKSLLQTGYTDAQNELNEALSKYNSLQTSSVPLKKKVYDSCKEISTFLKELVTDPVTDVLAINGKIAPLTLGVFNSVTELYNESPRDEYLIQVEGLSHAIIRLKASANCNAIKTAYVEPKNLYVYAIKELGVLLSSVLGELSK